MTKEEALQFANEAEEKFVKFLNDKNEFERKKELLRVWNRYRDDACAYDFAMDLSNDKELERWLSIGGKVPEDKSISFGLADPVENKHTIITEDDFKAMIHAEWTEIYLNIVKFPWGHNSVLADIVFTPIIKYSGIDLLL